MSGLNRSNKRRHQNKQRGRATPKLEASPSHPKRGRKRKHGDSDSEYQPKTRSRKRSHRALPKTRANATQTTSEMRGTQMSHRQLLALEQDANLSQRQMMKIQKHTRNALGRSVFQADFKAASAKRNAMFAHLFESELVHSGDGDEANALWGVFATDFRLLLEFIEKQHGRQLERVHIGCDFGKQFLKVAFTCAWEPENDDSANEKVADLDETEDENSDQDDNSLVKAARADLQQQMHPQHGRRRTILAAVIPLLGESFDVLSDVFSRLNFPADQDFVFLGDAKLLNIVFGLSTNAAMHGCPFCDQHITSSNSSKELQLKAGELRTYRLVCEHVAALHEEGPNSKHSDHASCIKIPLPLFQHRPDMPFVDVAAQPGLHYLLGSNWIWHRLEQLLPSLPTWWRRYNLVRPEYHGGDFEGNACRLLLRDESLDALKIIVETAAAKDEVDRRQRSNRPPRKNVPRHDMLLLFDLATAFGAVVTGCFSKKLRPGWRVALENFRDAAAAAPGNRVSIKFHAVAAHVQPWCEKHGVGIGAVTEQSLESTHHDFQSLWQTAYEVVDVASDAFGFNLKACVCSYNSRRVPFTPEGNK